MPVAVHRYLDGRDQMVSAIKTVQTFLGRPVNVGIDNQAISAEIIKLQTYLQTQGKFSAGNINREQIDDQRLSEKIIAVEVAANLP